MERERVDLTRTASRAATAGGVAGLVSLVVVLAGEITQGTDFMKSGLAEAAGFLGFLAACLMMVGLIGLAVRYGGTLSAVGRAALVVLTFAGAVMAGASSTLALIVPSLVDRFPELATDPPAIVPASFILSGLAMGVSGVVLALGLRRTATVPSWATTLMVVGSVVTIVPLPSRFFLLSFAVGALLAVRATAAVDPVGVERIKV